MRYWALGALAALLGAATYHLIPQGRSEDVFCLGLMGVLTGWFILTDLHVDDVIERDKAIAEYEAKQWR
jgi:hypothetical protein